MSDSNIAFADGDGVTVTIKYGKGYEETWAIFKGSVRSVRQMVIEYFGVAPEAVIELTTHELVVNMTSVAQGTGNAAATLGAVAIPASQSGPTQTKSSNPWANLGDAESKPEAAEHPFQSVLDAIAASPNVTELQKVWASNQPAFQDETVTAAYKARGKELTAK